jgi:hypothetical protein
LHLAPAAATAAATAAAATAAAGTRRDCVMEDLDDSRNKTVDLTYPRQRLQVLSRKVLTLVPRFTYKHRQLQVLSFSATGRKVVPRMQLNRTHGLWQTASYAKVNLFHILLMTCAQRTFYTRMSSKATKALAM